MTSQNAPDAGVPHGRPSGCDFELLAHHPVRFGVHVPDELVGSMTLRARVARLGAPRGMVIESVGLRIGRELRAGTTLAHRSRGPEELWVVHFQLKPRALVLGASLIVSLRTGDPCQLSLCVSLCDIAERFILSVVDPGETSCARPKSSRGPDSGTASARVQVGPATTG